MGGAALAAVALGRPRDGLNALAVACFAMAVWDPTVVLDLGFRLSALATLGLIVLSPRLLPLVQRLPGWMGSVLTMTVAAELMVLPVLAADFNQLSLVGLPANLAVVPLIPGAMEWAVVAAACGALWEPLAQVPAW
jgi:competence protein ComEC